MSIITSLKRGARYIVYGIPVMNNIIKVKITTTNPNQILSSKKIIITGGGRGLGFAMAKKFISEGARVLIAGRNEDILKKSASVIGCEYLVLDVRKVSSFIAFIDEADRILEGIDCLVNNAGISLHEKNFMDVSLEQFDDQINTNFRGGFFLTQSFIRRVRQNKGERGNVLFVSSETGITVDERPYGLTKAGINSLVQGLAYKYINEGIRVNAIAPGVTTSDMTGLKSDGNLYYQSGITNRAYLPEEVAEVACFLLSDASNVLNGQILICNEGKTINFRK